jgi:hypothetical protein
MVRVAAAEREPVAKRAQAELATEHVRLAPASRVVFRALRRWIRRAWIRLPRARCLWMLGVWRWRVWAVVQVERWLA